MTWTDTHRRWQALQEIETLANAGCTDLPWNRDYAEIFGEPEDLVAALRYRLELSRTTQLDTHLPEDVLEEQRRRIIERSAGVVRLIERHESGTTYPRVPELTTDPGTVSV